MMLIYSQMIIPLFPYGSGYSIVPPFITGWWFFATPLKNMMGWLFPILSPILFPIITIFPIYLIIPNQSDMVISWFLADPHTSNQAAVNELHGLLPWLKTPGPWNRGVQLPKVQLNMPWKMVVSLERTGCSAWKMGKQLIFTMENIGKKWILTMENRIWTYLNHDMIHLCLKIAQKPNGHWKKDGIDDSPVNSGKAFFQRNHDKPLELSNGNCVFNIVDLHLRKKNKSTDVQLQNNTRNAKSFTFWIINHYEPLLTIINHHQPLLTTIF